MDTSKTVEYEPYNLPDGRVVSVLLCSNVTPYMYTKMHSMKHGN